MCSEKFLLCNKNIVNIQPHASIPQSITCRDPERHFTPHPPLSFRSALECHGCPLRSTRHQVQCGPQQDDHFWGSTCSPGDHNSMSCSCDHQISHGEGIFPPIRLGAPSRPPHGLQNGAASPPGAVLALWGEPSHLCLHTVTSQPAAGLSAVFWEL